MSSPDWLAFLIEQAAVPPDTCTIALTIPSIVNDSLTKAATGLTLLLTRKGPAEPGKNTGVAQVSRAGRVYCLDTLGEFRPPSPGRHG